MAIKITDDCINCGACEPECPNNAIYSGGTNWSAAQGTAVSGSFKLKNGSEIDAYADQEPISNDFYFIVPEKCTECKGFHDEPQCASVCPVDCCLPDADNSESADQLLAKKAMLHGE
ncbi:MAG: 4Fe-4S dicluster domain-containing protein [Crocinitomicaceae bacterium]|nr:4Fe-4S dicluster domain-containing protein [Crocinitomicaceae bacterium]MBK8924499.1 4Fe-4S dicluster domain-containing protein [Crocinitomicaceae bacterium]